MSSAQYNEGYNGGHEGVTFLTNEEKAASKKRVVVVTGVFLALLVIAAVAGFLIWYFIGHHDTMENATLSEKRKSAVRVFSGQMELSGVQYLDTLEDPTSRDFEDMANTLEDTLAQTLKQDPILDKFFKKSVISAFSEGVKAYYWTEFEIPAGDLELLPEVSEERVMEVLHSQLRHHAKQSLQQLTITDVTVSFTDSRMARNPRANECFHRLEAEASVQTFESPGFPEKYPPQARCQWQIRAPKDTAIFIKFPFFHVEDDCSNDFVFIYDSLSPDDTQAITKQCGQRPPTNQLEVVSSSNILLINLISDSSMQRPGFKGEFLVIPVTTAQTCGGSFTDSSGTFSSPHFPSFYPPAIDCKWTISVPKGLQVRLTFTMFRMKEPGVDMRVCHKDYVEVMGVK
ncbi:hypothetical protein ACEWY4_020557 [Coilia grayii]|uniref:Uncharacterized protein n=1 Tax=Coilia grayii TaxID=363190 RepID=A0ABD1JD09_9TELE